MSAWELAVVVAAVAVGFFVKGMTGMGGPLLAIPVMAGFLGVERAVVVILVPTLAVNFWLLWEHRSGRDSTRDLSMLLGTGMAGAVLGTWLLKQLDDRILSLVLAGVVVVYVLRRLRDPEFRLSERMSRMTSPPIGFLSGVLQGATGVSGPLLAAYLHSFRMGKSAFVFSLTAVFQVLAGVQFVTLVALDMYTPSRMMEGLLAMIPVAVVFPLGILVSRRMRPRAFDLAVLALLVVAAGRLVMNALGGPA